MKRFCIFLVSFIIVIFLLSTTTTYAVLFSQPIMESIPTEETILPTVNEEIIFNEYRHNYYYEKLDNKEEIFQRFSTIETYIHELKNRILQELLDNGVEEDVSNHLIEEEIDYALDIMGQYRIDYDKIIYDEKWQKHYAEYYNATEVWLYFKNELGWSDEVAAGVMGNLMAETGGHTLAIQWQRISNDGSAGICQWKTNFPDRAWLVNANLQQQLDFLKGNVEEQINKWAPIKYKEGFTYTDFCNLDSPEEVAKVFALAYERCNAKYVAIRLKNAIKAYDYFTGTT